MNMRKKPDTRAFVSKDPTDFLNGAEPALANTAIHATGNAVGNMTGSATNAAMNAAAITPNMLAAAVSQTKQTKIFNLSADVVQALKYHAYHRSSLEGRRVTETELVDAALRQYLNI